MNVVYLWRLILSMLSFSAKGIVPHGTRFQTSPAVELMTPGQLNSGLTFHTFPCIVPAIADVAATSPYNQGFHLYVVI